MTSKQRAFLRGLANPLDPILYVGKGGISSALEKQADDALQARELVKGRVLETSPFDVQTAANFLSRVTGSEVVQVMGCTFVLYLRHPKEPKIELPKD